MQRKDYPEILSEIAHHLAAKLIDCGINETRANEASFEAVEYIRKMYGGQNPYIPRGIKFNANERDEEIYRKYQGDNIQELASEYQLSIVSIYKIVAKFRAKPKQICSTAQS